jgi:hypothetical protein
MGLIKKADMNAWALIGPVLRSGQKISDKKAWEDFDINAMNTR